MAPTIPPRFQMRRTAPPIRPQSGWHLDDAQLLQGRADNHLGREFHAGRLQSQISDRACAKASEAAMEVANRDVEEQSAKEAQDGIAEPTVKQRHRAWLDTTAESVPHDKIITGAKPIQERTEIGEIVA